LFVDQLAQLAQVIGTEEGATCADRDHRGGAVNISPFERQRAQPPFCVHIRHTVSTPVVTYDKGFETLALQRMERVRDGENLYAATTTICNARFLPKEK
jgi:hypothetical protein